MYMNFMYVYVLCHKEGHAWRTGLFAKPYHHLLCRVFNWWIGLFHGVVPGVFTCSHLYNHHRYDNDENDVYTTGGYRRDSLWTFVRYVAVWFGYALNITSFFAFVREGRYKLAAQSVAGSACYAAFVAAVWSVSPPFAMAGLIYPLVEANVMLGIVNYTWHAFIDPDTPRNEYVNSLTIVDGLNFTLEEEYHVVHHLAAGVHWTKTRPLYEAALAEYDGYKSSRFYKANLFEMFGLIVSGQYGALADRFYDPDKKLDRAKLVALLEARLRHTTH